MSITVTDLNKPADLMCSETPAALLIAKLEATYLATGFCFFDSNHPLSQTTEHQVNLLENVCVLLLILLMCKGTACVLQG